MGEPSRPWQPMTREQFRELQHGDQVQDRYGRVWTLRAAAYLDASTGEYRAVLIAGEVVLVERERVHDSYMLVGAA